MQLSLQFCSYLAYFCEYTIILLWTLHTVRGGILAVIGLSARDTTTHHHHPSASHGAFIPLTIALAGDFGSIRMDDFGFTLLHGSQGETMFH